MPTEELTGRRRYKEMTWFQYGPRSLKLQVEVAVFRTIHEFDKKTGIHTQTPRWVCEWRDARPEDVPADQLVP